jgi:hypothetical protein
MLTASIIRAIVLMMEAASSSKTSVNFYQTTRRIFPEDSHLHTRRRDLKSFPLVRSTSYLVKQIMLVRTLFSVPCVDHCVRKTVAGTSRVRLAFCFVSYQQTTHVAAASRRPK